MLISPEDLAQLEETIDVLSDPAALADIREAGRTPAPRVIPPPFRINGDLREVVVLRIEHRLDAYRPM